MMAGIRNKLSTKYRLMLSILIIVMCSGYFLVYLRFAKPRGFKGDFYAAMYDPNWWDGNGIFYSPIFVIERWIVNSLPSLATIEMFAFGCLGLLVSSLLIILKIVHADRVFTIFCIVIWTFNTYFYYSFSVAANPEILELVFLSIAWWCLSTKRYPLTWFVVTCAVLTKSVPIIFAPLLLLFFSWGGLVISVVTTASVLAIVSFGQKQSIFSSISQIVNIVNVPPQPESEQFLGLSNGLARLFGVPDGGNFYFATKFAFIIIATLYFLAIFVSRRIYKSNYNHEVKVAYIFAVYMCLMPIFHLAQTHRHTYLFLAPVFIAFRFVIVHDSDLIRARTFKAFNNIVFLVYSFAPIYVLDVFSFRSFSGLAFGSDFDTSLLMLTEPVWTNILLFSVLLSYGIKATITPRIKI